jgi:large subunit ribosomal protein L6
VPIPSGVTCTLKDGHLEIKGAKGSLARDLHRDITVNVESDAITLTRSSDKPEHRALHGLTRALVNNMVVGVTDGFQKVLEIVGVGYRASMQGKSLNLVLGLSHPVVIEPPTGIAFDVDGTQTIKVSGIDKELVGQTAADIRAWRKPEPYKGKGIRYQGEHIRRKVGKTGAAS